MTDHTTPLLPRTARWETDAGPVLVQFPAALSETDLDELEEFWTLQMRTLRRIALKSGAVGGGHMTPETTDPIADEIEFWQRLRFQHLDGDNILAANECLLEIKRLEAEHE